MGIGAALSASCVVWVLAGASAPFGVACGLLTFTTQATAAQAMTFDSPAAEPAVPLNLWLNVRVDQSERSVKITAFVGKREGYPAEMFDDRNVEVRIELPPDLQLKGGSLVWSGDLKGSATGSVTATVEAAGDVDATILVSAHAEAQGGRVDADREALRLSFKGKRAEVVADQAAPASPLAPGPASPAQ